FRIRTQSVFVCFFFFSSRRRHTRFSRDWSSDVCPSDLGGETGTETAQNAPSHIGSHIDSEGPGWISTLDREIAPGDKRQGVCDEIGRASCRERGGVTEGAAALRTQRKRQDI